MTQLTDNFRLEEFAVSAAHPELVVPVPYQYWDSIRKLAETCLQPIRDLWGKPMHVDSGYRSDALNKAVGGSPTSQHKLAEAADISTENVRNLFVLLLTENPKFPTGQVIYYPAQQFVHIALPSERYPNPSFFVSLTKKSYTRISSLSALNSISPK